MTEPRSANLTLPYPPSVNRYYRHIIVKGSPRTLISKDGRRYRDAVKIATTGLRMGERRLAVYIRVYPPDRRRRDLDNIQKPLLDALEKAGVYENDCQIDYLSTTRYPVDRENPRVAVSIVLIGDD